MPDFLGKIKFNRPPLSVLSSLPPSVLIPPPADFYHAVPPPGVVMGLGANNMGGSGLFVETVAQPATKKCALPRLLPLFSPSNSHLLHSAEIRITGQLGDVMKESISSPTLTPRTSSPTFAPRRISSCAEPSISTGCTTPSPRSPSLSHLAFNLLTPMSGRPVWRLRHCYVPALDRPQPARPHPHHHDGRDHPPRSRPRHRSVPSTASLALFWTATHHSQAA